MSTVTTITGWVGADPTLLIGKNGRPYANIRVASTDRFRNANQEWVDGQTQWFGVRLFGAFAENAVASVRRGEPVVVTGRFVLETWETEERSGSTLVLFASAMGHDISRGRSAFTRVVHTSEVPGNGRDIKADDPTPDAPTQDEEVARPVPDAGEGDVSADDPFEVQGAASDEMVHA